MKLLVTDTNVFFDVISIDALPEFFALDYEICTTDFVVKEILESNQKEQIESFIRSKKLTVFKLTDLEIEDVRVFRTNRSFKGITDKTVLWKSFQLKCLLLTGDKKLRNEALDLLLEVHGTIWIINSLIDQGIVSKAGGIEFFEKLILINNSLPHDKIRKLIKELK